jgi:hypothetical protein
MHKFSRLFLLAILFFISFNSQAQYKKHFTGMLEYKISVRDTSMRNMMPDNRMIVYTNDTVVRIENFTQNLGKQVAIKHMNLGKSYLLLETEFGNFALQMNDSEEISSEPNPNDTASAAEYIFDKKCFKRPILGIKAKNLLNFYTSRDILINY